MMGFPHGQELVERFSKQKCTDCPSNLDCASAKAAVNWEPLPGNVKTGLPKPTYMGKCKTSVNKICPKEYRSSQSHMQNMKQEQSSHS